MLYISSLVHFWKAMTFLNSLEKLLLLHVITSSKSKPSSSLQLSPRTRPENIGKMFSLE